MSEKENAPIEKLGEFSIGQEIARGGMGVVYRGMDEDLKRPVAVKMLPPKFFKSDQDRERFILEAQIVAKLDHPNIMKVYAIRYAQDTVWIVMELLHGEPLSDILKEKNKLSGEESAEILDQCVNALRYAHEKNIVHRDIKPSNVMVDQDGRVKVMDYGIALDQESNLNLTQEGTIMGTPKYMSPEQFTGEKVDHRTDIYSLGVMAYEMITGHAPFSGKNFAQIAYKHIHEPLPSYKKEVTNVPPALDFFIKEATKKKREERLSDLSKIHLSTLHLKTIAKTKKYKISVILLSIIFIAVIVGFFLLSHFKQIKIDKQTVELVTEVQRQISYDNGIEAKNTLTKLESIAPNHSDLNFLKQEVNALAEKERKKIEARKLFSQAMEQIGFGHLEEFEKKLSLAKEMAPSQAMEFETSAMQARLTYKKIKAQKHYENAIRALGESNPKKASKLLLQCIQMAPDFYQAYFVLADYYLEEEGDTQKYCESMEKGLRGMPRRGDTEWHKLSLGWSELGQAEKALHACQSGLGYFPKSIKLENLLKTYQDLDQK